MAVGFEGAAIWIQNLLPLPRINVFGMDCVKEELNKEASTSSTSTPTHLQKLFSIYKKDNAPATVPNITYIASDCVDHFFAGMKAKPISSYVHSYSQHLEQALQQPRI